MITKKEKREILTYFMLLTIFQLNVFLILLMGLYYNACIQDVLSP